MNPVWTTDFPVRLSPQGEAAGTEHYLPALRLERNLRNTVLRRERVHYRGIQDKNERLMVIICYNTDLGDG
jgi:hypothetical protein